MLAPASVAGTLTRPFTCSVRSTGTTAVAPSGTSAPVEIAIASPWRTVAPAGCPARDSATTSSSAGSPAITAYPSMAELSNGGTEIWLATSSASTRPSASVRATSSAGSGCTASSTSRRASATAIRSPISRDLVSEAALTKTGSLRRFREYSR